MWRGAAPGHEQEADNRKGCRPRGQGHGESRRPAGSVVLVHGPIASLNWPPMTMKFLVKDKALWEKLAEGKQVEVEFTQEGKDYVVTKVK
ncbi:copper-binding protein [Variovorax sp. JS1663]|uniref:copper-binding protein n=1 Tax=Variovorax sp. JS1663 TaxID=1851577 RepID=UPI003FD25437